MILRTLLIALAVIALLSNAIPGAEQPKSLEIASVQMAVSSDIDANLQRIREGIAAARDAGARVAMFPETALSGFEKEDIEHLDWQRLQAAMEMVAALAKEHRIYVLYGCATPSARERPFNSAVLVGPDGAEVMRYHKMYPEKWFEPGDHLALFEIDGVPCTVIVCHDNRFPELVRIPVLAGARICFYISYEINSLSSALRKMEGYRAQLIARAVENGVWIVQSNGFGPIDTPGRVSLGYSRVVAPDGRVVQEAPGMADTMLLAEVRPGEAGRGNALEALENPYLAGWWQEGIDLLQSAPATENVSCPKPPADGNSVRLALMQSVPEKWNLKANFEVFLRLLDDAGDADIFVTPECWLDGYASPDKSSTPERLREVAQDPAQSAYLQRVSEEARRRAMYICFGFTSLEEGKIYNAAGLWDREGRLAGIYHKTHLQTHDLQYSPGMDLPVWPTPWGPVGIMICADRRWPETARTLRLKGARLILNPTYGMSHVANEWWMRTRGYENQCFIAFAHPEVSFVVNPKGAISAKRDHRPGVLICDIDLRRATDDNHLRDRRPELYEAITALPDREEAGNGRLKK